MALNILSSLIKCVLRDFPVSDTDVLDPTDANAFQQGDWYMLDDTAGQEGNIRVVGAADVPGVAFPVWSRRGEGTTQMLESLTVVYGGPLTFDTDRFDDTQVYAPGTALTALNGVLTPQAGVVGSTTFAFVELPPDNNNNLLRVRLA